MTEIKIILPNWFLVAALVVMAIEIMLAGALLWYRRQIVKYEKRLLELGIKIACPEKTP